MTASSSAPYLAPFAVLIGFLTLRTFVPLPVRAGELALLLAMLAVLWFVARPALDFRVSDWAGSTALGLAIFALWIAPDLFSPAYRHSILFENALTGKAAGSLSRAALTDPLAIGLRGLRAVAIVPVAEELFWRGWLMRWLVAAKFAAVPLGTYLPSAFWLTAVLFAAEHGPYWDVGLAAGILLNLWMIRTRSLGDLILAHSAANFALSVYVVAAGKWEYWL